MKIKMIRRLLVCFCASSAFLLQSASADLVHSYLLDGNFDDEFLGPSLIPAGEGVFTSGGYQFAAGQGLSLSGALSNPAEYSLLIDFSFSELGGYRKIVDFGNLSVDDGVYAFSTAFEAFSPLSYETGPFDDLTEDMLVRLVITRDAAGIFSLYVNGNLRFSIEDSGGSFVFSGDDAIIRFFQDDATTGGEEVSAGLVKTIRVYDTVLTEEEVSSLGPVPEPSTAVLFGIAGAAFLSLVRNYRPRS
jgi:hypothetical protein